MNRPTFDAAQVCGATPEERATGVYSYGRNGSLWVIYNPTGYVFLTLNGFAGELDAEDLAAHLNQAVL
jgi:hypothetical protein